MKRSNLIILLIILGILIAIGFFISDPETGEQILVALGLKESTQQGYVLSGLVEAQVTILSSEYGGKVLEVSASEGEEVEEGELIARLDDSMMRSQLDAANAQLDIASASLEMVEAGPRRIEVDVAEANVALARAVRDGALLSIEDARNSDPISLRDERIAVAQASLDQTEANLRIAESVLNQLVSGSTQTRLDSALAGEAIAAAEVARLETMVGRQNLTAPMDAVVLDVHLLPGEIALPGQPIVSLTDISEVEVTVYVPEFDLNWMSLGEIIEVKFDAYPDRSYVGVVIHISDRAEFTPRNIQTPEERVILVYPVTVRIANPGGDLKPGLTVDVIFGGGS